MIFLLGACGKNEDKENILKEVTYNVVYMGEDSNLEDKRSMEWVFYKAIEKIVKIQMKI